MHLFRLSHLPTRRMSPVLFAVGLSLVPPLAACAASTAEDHSRRREHPAETKRQSPTAPTTLPTVVAAPKGEIRAMWIVRDSLSSPSKIRNAVALAKANHFNTLFVQVRGRGDAYYHSHYEPRAEELAGQPDSFDPLQTAIDEGHKAGLEVHAWLDTFFVWHRPRRPYSSQHVVNQHPEWLVQDRNGNTTMTEKKDIEGAFLDPAIPEVREYTKNVFLDVVNHYNIDGLHFDYCRFPNSDYSFSRADVRAFREWLTPKISAADATYADSRAQHNRLAWTYCFPEHWRDWRRLQVTTTVKSIADEAHRVKPDLIVSAAVFPGYRTAYEDKGQAWHTWLQMGILDAACPMSYNKATELVGAQIRDAVANSSGKPIVAGVGAWQMSAASAIAKAQVYRQLGAAGINFFSYDGMTRDGKSDAYLAQVGHTLFATPAPTPLWHHSGGDTANPAKPIYVLPAAAPPIAIPAAAPTAPDAPAASDAPPAAIGDKNAPGADSAH